MWLWGSDLTARIVQRVGLSRVQVVVVCQVLQVLLKVHTAGGHAAGVPLLCKGVRGTRAVRA